MTAGVILLLLGALAIASPTAAQPAAGAVAGIVDVAGADGQALVLPGVTLTLTCPKSLVRVAVTDADGAYRITGVPPGSCAIVAELEGFLSTTRPVGIEPDRTAEVPLRLAFDTLREDVTVTAGAGPTLEQPGVPAARLEQRTLQNAPIANDRFQDALPLIPGVVRGPDGLLNNPP